MGWASGDEVFDPVAKALLRLTTYDVTYEVCRILIEQLQGRGWDTECESLGEFLDYPEIVAAFAANGVEMGGEDGCG